MGYIMTATKRHRPRRCTLRYPTKENTNVRKSANRAAAESYLLDKREFESVIVSQTFGHK